MAGQLTADCDDSFVAAFVSAFPADDEEFMPSVPN
jgi:hypothetical protein